jgi:hypothetical protein
VNSSTGRGEGEDEIIMLDKENVNPGAFRRKREKGKEKKESGHTREQKEKERAGLGVRSNVGNVRKCTLSDFMEEKEAEGEREWAIAAETSYPILILLIHHHYRLIVDPTHPLRYGLLSILINHHHLVNILKLSLDSQPYFSSTYLVLLSAQDLHPSGLFRFGGLQRLYLLLLIPRLLVLMRYPR